MVKEKRAIIVGAGINGLLLGALLSDEGYNVIIFEKENIGGRAALKYMDGFSIDNGIHLIRFGPKSALARIMRSLDKPIIFKKLAKSFIFDHDGIIKLFPTGPVD